MGQRLNAPSSDELERQRVVRYACNPACLEILSEPPTEDGLKTASGIFHFLSVFFKMRGCCISLHSNNSV